MSVRPRLSRLSVLASDVATSAPLAGVPFYAEIVAPALVQPDERLIEALNTALNSDDKARVAPHRDRVLAAFFLAAARVLPRSVRDRLVADYRVAAPLFTAALDRTRQGEGAASLADIPPARLAEALEAAIEATAEAAGMDAVDRSRRDRGSTAYPLGTLATDHAGYLSYDLDALPRGLLVLLDDAVNRIREDPSLKPPITAWLYALGNPTVRFDALEQQRFSERAILARLDLPATLSAVQAARTAGLATMQAPSLTDWRLSPASFAANPAALLGNETGCESLLPANLSLQEFFFHEVVGLQDAADLLPQHLRGLAAVGIVHEYKVAWYSLGHSLGAIQYSLPLAPGESVNLAVIDWTRRDDAQRKEVGKFDEQLAHQENRDRAISESVHASITEVQRGKSFMAGLAASVGASGMLGGLGVAAGIANAIGGSSATTSGTRDIAATSVQNVADRISQHTAASRELHSTVVVQASQAEQQVIQTRTVTNQNHSHTLTVLYHEVLRHYRLVTSLVRTRAVVLFQHKADWFAGEPAGVDRNIVVHRETLQRALLDQTLAADLEAISRIDSRRRAALVVPQPAAQPAVAAGPDLRFFWFELTTGGIVPGEDQEVRIYATLYPGGIKLAGGRRLNPGGSFSEPNGKNQFVGLLPDGTRTVRWGDIDLVNIFVERDKAGTRVSFKEMRITGIDGDGKELPLVTRSYEGGHLILDNDADIGLPALRPPSAPAGRPQADIDDDLARARLVAHFIDNNAHYSRAIFLGLSPADRLVALGDIAAHVENKPLDVVGHSTAFPCSNPAWSDAVIERVGDHKGQHVQDERLVTLPTRGVFAEAMLGHCNASEVIDNTRFWDWQSSPIPQSAPQIAPVQPVVPQVNNLNPQPSAFPQSMVNIVTPQAAPDPTALASAITALSAPNVFRDMSGQTEVGALLQRLSDNSISIAEAANVARSIQGRQRSNVGRPGLATGGTHDGGRSGPGGVGGPRAKSNNPSATNRDLHDYQDVLGRAVKNDLITPEQAQGLFGSAAAGALNPGSDPGANGWGTQNFFQENEQNVSDLMPVSGSVSFDNVVMPAGERLCFPVSQFATTQFASGFGTLAERYIEDDYCAEKGCAPDTVYMDNNNPTYFKDFLRDHNPGLTGTTVQLALVAAGAVRPDILRDDGAVKEYYEIKAQSPSGVEEGMKKLVVIMGYIKAMGLAYVPGVSYSPSKDIPMMSGTMLNCKIGVSLNVQRYLPGLLTYSICLHGELKELFAKAALAAILAWIAAQLLARAPLVVFV